MQTQMNQFRFNIVATITFLLFTRHARSFIASTSRRQTKTSAVSLNLSKNLVTLHQIHRGRTANLHPYIQLERGRSLALSFSTHKMDGSDEPRVSPRRSKRIKKEESADSVPPSPVVSSGSLKKKIVKRKVVKRKVTDSAADASDENLSSNSDASSSKEPKKKKLVKRKVKRKVVKVEDVSGSDSDVGDVKDNASTGSASSPSSSVAKSSAKQKKPTRAPKKAASPKSKSKVKAKKAKEEPQRITERDVLPKLWNTKKAMEEHGSYSKYQ